MARAVHAETSNAGFLIFIIILIRDVTSTFADKVNVPFLVQEQSAMVSV